MADTIRILSRKGEPSTTVVERLPARLLADGEVRLKIDSFALTTNNITYAAYGDTIGYWRVFPTDNDALGAMPVWGFAYAIETTVEAVPLGTKVWGFLPVANEVIVSAASVTPRSFFDPSPHRRAVPDVYSRYIRCAGDPAYRPELEAYQSLYRPLFITSYTAFDHLKVAGFHGATRMLISSASSKTAYGMAWCARNAGLELVGLTGSRNRTFVEGLGIYDTIRSYSDIEDLPAGGPIIYADFAADTALRSRVHHHFGKSLVYDAMIGSTQSNELAPDQRLPGPAPEFFFAATRLDQHRRDGTIHDFLTRFERDQATFIRQVGAASPHWVTIETCEGAEAIAAAIADLGRGHADPRVGYIARM